MADPISATIAAIVAAVADATATTAVALGASAATATSITTAVAGAVGALGFQSGLITGLMAWGTISSLAGVFTPKIAGSNKQVDWKADPYAPIPYVVGRTGFRGNIVYEKRHGSDGKYHMTTTVYGGPGPYEGMESVAFANPKNDAEDDPPITVTFDTDGAVETYPFLFGGNAQMWSRTFVGDFPQSARTQPPDYVGDDFDDWYDGAHKLNALAGFELLTANYGGVYQTTDIVTPMPIWKGGLCYDPRLDSTYPGGSGSHRWADPQSDPSGHETARHTWEWSEDPWIIGLNWALGRWVRDTTTSDPWRLVQGVGARIALIDVAAWVAAANVSETNGWKVGGVVYSADGADGDSKWQALIAMCQAGGGKPMPMGGKLSCSVRAPLVSLATLSGADFTGQTFNAKGGKPRRDRINTITPSYRSEPHGWQIVAADEIVIDAYVTTRLGIRPRAITYGLVQDVNQAAQLAYYDVADSNERGPITGTAAPRWGLGLRPGDCVTLDDPEFGMGGPVKVVVLSRSLDPMSAEYPLTFQTETDSKHALALAQTGSAPPV